MLLTTASLGLAAPPSSSSGGTTAVEHPDGAPLPELLNTLEAFRFTQFDADKIRAAIDAGMDVDIPVGNGTYRLRLEYHNVLSPDFVGVQILPDGSYARLPTPRPLIYRGDVVDSNGTPLREETEAMLHFHNHVLNGLIRTPDGVINIQPALTASESGSSTYVVYETKDLRPFGLGALDESNGHGEGMPHIHEGNRSANAAASEGSSAAVTTASSGSGTIRIAAFFDEGYQAQAGSGGAAMSRIAADVAAAEVIFDTKASYNFQVPLAMVLTNSALGSCTEAGHLLRHHVRPQMESTTVALEIDVNTGHLWTTRDLVGAGEKSDVCDGSGTLYGAGYKDEFTKQLSLSTVQILAEGTYNPTANDAHRRIATAHEIGHVLGGDHCRAHYTANFFGYPSTKTVMAPWSTLPEEEREQSSTCVSEPADGIIYLYDYVEEFSSQPNDNNNVARMAAVTAAGLAVPATPNTPTGATTGVQGALITSTFTPPGSPCVYVQVAWGDGTRTTYPRFLPIDECRSATFSLDHAYAAPGTYSVTWRVKNEFYGPWSPWSTGKTVTVTSSCTTDDSGSGCDAGNTLGQATSISSSPISGYLPTADLADFFVISVPSGSTLSATLTPPSCSDFDLYIYNPSMTLAGSSAAGGCSIDSVTLQNVAGGAWYLEARMYHTPSTAPYTLSYTIGGNQVPTASITSPGEGSTVSGQVTVQGSGADPEGTLQRVEVRIDSGAWLVASGTTSWSHTWDSTTVTNGAHTISARSFDGTQYSTVATRTVSVSNGGGQAPLIIKDDDGVWDRDVVLNFGDDLAVKRLVIPTTALTGASSAVLQVHAVAEKCTVTGNSHRLKVNGVTQLDFNPCNVWSTSTRAWREFAVTLSSLQAGTTNSFEFVETAGDWNDRNIIFQIDQSNDVGRSDAQENGNSIAGEFLWRLQVTY